MAVAPPFDYPAALEYISSTGRFGIKMGLERTRALLDAVGAPDAGMTGVLVGGTNGKGSTCAVLASILEHAGLRVASMPKPHLLSYTERVVVDGAPISEPDFARAVGEMVPAVDAVTRTHGAPTEFEILTALALRHARDSGCDVMVCEVGMGGRLDATNITRLGVKVITSIAMDHQQYLGDTLAAVATEKAGIIHPGDLVVAGPLPGEAMQVVRGRCAEVGAELVAAGSDFAAAGLVTRWAGSGLDLDASVPWIDAMPGLHSPLLGKHQADNIAVAVVAAQAMRRKHGLHIDDGAIRAGVAAARWPGRLELFPGAPRVLVDGGHNPAAVAAVVQSLRELGTDHAPVLLFGAMADKDVEGMLAHLPADWRAVFTQVSEGRALPAEGLLELARGQGRDEDVAVADVPTALGVACERAGAEGLVLVLGSLYLAGAVRPLVAR